MDQLSKYAPLIARLFIGVFFLLAGVGKIADIPGTAGYIDSVGLPGALAWPATLFEIALGLSILLGFKLRIAALAGAGFCIFTAVFFHNNFADQTQMVMFLKNFSIAGAFLMFFAHGAGTLALDKA
jgi:putative oxidoreductase